VFMAAIKGTQGDFLDSEGRIAVFNPPQKVPGTIPAHVNPPKEIADNAPTGGIFGLASSESKPVQVASASSSQSSGGFFSNLFGSKKEEPAPAQPAAPAAPAKPKATAKPAAKPQTATASVVAVRPKPPAEPQTASAVQEPPASKPESSQLLTGAAPTVQANS